MNELKLIKNLGAITSAELEELIDKNKRGIIRALNGLELIGEIKIIIFRTETIRRRVYCSNEIYNNLFKIKKS